MELKKSPDGWALALTPQEAVVLAISMDELIQHYRIDPENLSRRLKDFWNGRISARPGDAALLEDEAEHLKAERFGWRSERLIRLEKWLATFPRAEEQPWTLLLSTDDFEEFLCILNDRRLLLAVEHNVTEADMDTDPAYVRDEIKARALWEIHMLAYIQEYCLEVNRAE
jgi:hypothetical protein